MNSANRVILNTAVSYTALLIKMAVGIFSVRFVLKALGETNYGIYIAVAGVAALLEMLNASMISTSMRYIAYSLGGDNKQKIRDTFNTSLFVHYIFGFVTIFIMEVFGVLFLEYVLNIPPEMMPQARIIFQMMVMSTFITVIAVPYDAVMNAHEHIWILSVYDVIGAILSLGMAVYLMYSSGDRLIIYGAYQLGILILLRFMKVMYSKRHFEECRQVSFKQHNKPLVKEMLSFTGWTLFGNLAATFSTHLRGIVMNVFFGVRLNASEGVSRQVNNYVNMIAASMTKAINPQMNKSEGGGDRERMKRVTSLASKYSAFLFALVGIPFMIEAPYIFSLWLEEVPEYAIIFTQISMITILISKYTTQIGHAIYAVGNIRLYQVLESIMAFIPLALTYVFYRMGFEPVTAYWIGLVCIFLTTAERYYLGKKIVGIDLWAFTRDTVIKTACPIFISGGLSLLIVMGFAPSFMRMLSVFIVFCLSYTILFFVFGVNKDEKQIWIGLIKGLSSKIKNKV